MDQENCLWCGKPYLLVWQTSDGLWEKVTGKSDGSGLSCVDCFTAMAEERGIILYWTCSEDEYPSRGRSMMIYRLELEHHFDSAHYLPGHPGKCAWMHGHRWEVKVVIQTTKLDDAGMVVDFGDIKNVINELDHKELNDVMDNPTAENIAEGLWQQVVERVTDMNAVVLVTVQESPGCSITVGDTCDFMAIAEGC